MKKILLCATHGIGDLIIISPMINLLMKSYAVTLLVNGPLEEEISKVIFAKPFKIYKFNSLNSYGKLKLLYVLNLSRYNYVLPQIDVSKYKFLILSLSLLKIPKFNWQPANMICDILKWQDVYRLICIHTFAEISIYHLIN